MNPSCIDISLFGYVTVFRSGLRFGRSTRLLILVAMNPTVFTLWLSLLDSILFALITLSMFQDHEIMFKICTSSIAIKQRLEQLPTHP